MELGISVKTLEYHVKQAREQWGCRTMVQLAAKIPEWRLQDKEEEKPNGV